MGKILAQVSIAAVILSVSLVGCGSASPVQNIQILDPTTKPLGIIVLPVAQMVPATTALDVIARSHDAAAYLLQHTDLPILGPLDFSINKSVDDVRIVAADTDLFSRKEELGEEPRQWLALSLLITENRAENVRDIKDVREKDPKKQKIFRQHGIDAKVRVEVALLDPRRGTRVAGLSFEFDDDPTQFEPGGDPRPGITKAIQQALAHLLATSGEGLRGGGSRRWRGEDMVDNLLPLLAWSADDLKSFNVLHSADAEVTRDAKVLGLWDRFAPNLEMASIFHATRQSGLIVRKAHAPLLAGDLILSVSGHAVTATYQFDRLLQLAGNAGAKVQVWRNAAKMTVDVAWPQLPAIAKE